jgi:hypothetical protein
MKLVPPKYYHKDDMNRYCFFQPASSSKPLEETLEAINQVDSLPNPLDRHRIPVLRLVPSGYR